MNSLQKNAPRTGFCDKVFPRFFFRGNSAPVLLLAGCLLLGCGLRGRPAKAYLLRGITLVDGTGGPARERVSLLVRNDTIAGIPEADEPVPDGVMGMDFSGKTIIPALINGHGHLGLLKGNSAVSSNYSRENVLRQLNQYAAFGVGHVLSLGTDQQLIFGLRDSSQKGKLPGATVYTAGFGIGVRSGAPPEAFGSQVLRPSTPEEAVKAVQQLAGFKPDMVKLWVKDAGKTLPKMQPAVYKAVITEAHRLQLRVAAHVYYLEDARNLVKAGVDVLAHSIRDREADDALVQELKQRGVFYIPTLSLDDYAIAYATDPEWMDDPLFKASLEPGVWEQLHSEVYQRQQAEDHSRGKKVAAFQTTLRNAKKLDSAGVLVVLGTDSGAQQVRTQGFSEHLELQLLVHAGLSPLQAIRCATRQGAEMLHIADHCGTVQVGKKADFIILNGHPLQDIRQTRRIIAVWKNGQPVPL